MLTIGVAVAFGPGTSRAGEVEFISERLAEDELANNFDTELVARLVGLARTSAAGARRVLVVFDATSPVEKTRHFRRQGVRARGRCACDELLAAMLAAARRWR